MKRQHGGKRVPGSILDRVLRAFSSLVDNLLGQESRNGRVGQLPSAARFRSRYPLVEQSDDTGCGVACVAMLADVSYEDAKKAMFPSKRKRVFYTTYRDIRRAFQEYEIPFDDAGRPKRFIGWDSIVDTAIVAVELDTPVKHRWHWVVFVSDGRRRYVLDPGAPNIIRTDLPRLKGRTYLPLLLGAQSGNQRTVGTRRRRATATRRSTTDVP